MKIIILGEAGPYPGPGGSTTGILVQTDEGSFLIDCGSGVLAELQKYVTLESLDAVILTHFHADHIADLGVLQYAVMVSRKQGIRTNPLPIYANQNPAERFQEVSFQEDVQAIPIHSASELQLCGATIRFTDTIHAISCLAVSVEYQNHKFVFSGDTGPSQNVEQLAQNADLFLCEASWLEKDKGPATVGHLTAGQAGETGNKANVKELCLTHIYPAYSRDLLVQEAEEKFGREVRIAKKGVVFEI